MQGGTPVPSPPHEKKRDAANISSSSDQGLCKFFVQNLTLKEVEEKRVTWDEVRSNWRSPSKNNDEGSSSIQSPLASKKKLPTPPVNGVQVVDEFVNCGGRFTTRVPLPDMVSILVELWEMEEL